MANEFESTTGASNLEGARHLALCAAKLAKSHLNEAAGGLRAAAETTARDLRSAAEEKANELRGKAESAYSDARERARTFQEDTEQYVRENPTKAILSALGAGFVLGLIFKK
jgi:ElaB/YqjD/DUF883 family membrane-anchored ribosome-binding protein